MAPMPPMPTAMAKRTAAKLGRRPMGKKKGRGYAHKYKVLALVDRISGRAKSMVVDDLNPNFPGELLRWIF